MLAAVNLKNALFDEFSSGRSGALAFGNAWASYFKAGTLAGIPPLPAQVDAGVAQLRAAMALTGNATAAEGAATMRTALVAFWTHLQSNAAAYWSGATPGAPSAFLASVDAALVGAFAANLTPDTTRVNAVTRLADALHLGGIGGTLTIASTPVPIL